MPSTLKQDLSASGSVFLSTSRFEDEETQITNNPRTSNEEKIGNKNLILYEIPVSGASLPVQVIVLEPSEIEALPLLDTSVSFIMKNTDQLNNIDTESLRTSHEIPQIVAGKSPNPAQEIVQLAANTSRVSSLEIPKLASKPSTILSSKLPIDWTLTLPNPEVCCIILNFL